MYVVEGAFEVEGRLLHARDGLALWDVEEIEMEALSNDAIILFNEVNFNEPAMETSKSNFLFNP